MIVEFLILEQSRRNQYQYVVLVCDKIVGVEVWIQDSLIMVYYLLFEGFISRIGDIAELGNFVVILNHFLEQY